MKILSITEMVPQNVTLPNGVYLGKWSGHFIEVNYLSKTYSLQSETGVKGIDIQVMVFVKDGEVSFETVKNI